MKTLLVLVGLISVFLYPVVVAVPINSESSEDSTDLFKDSNESPSNESVYLVKEISYEVGFIGTVDLGNSSQIVIKPEDRVVTDDITFWASKNESNFDNETTTDTAPAETTLSSTDSGAAEAEEVNKETTSYTSQTSA